MPCVELALCFLSFAGTAPLTVSSENKKTKQSTACSEHHESTCSSICRSLALKVANELVPTRTGKKSVLGERKIPRLAMTYKR